MLLFILGGAQSSMTAPLPHVPTARILPQRAAIALSSRASLQNLRAAEPADDSGSSSGGSSMRAADDALAFRVRDAIVDDAEKPFMLWSEGDRRPLAVNLDLLNHRARVMKRRGKIDKAVETLEYCCKIDPNDGRAWIARSRIKEQAGLGEIAAELLREGLRWEPTSPYMLQSLGALQERRGLCDEALELYTASLRANPRHAPSWTSCGLLLEKRQQADAAAACLLTACAVDPRSYFVWQVIGEWRKRRGELGSAREAYRRSLQLNPRNAATFHAWGVLEWRCGHQELAEQLFRKGLEASPRNRYLIQSWACMEARAGRSDVAVELFRNATRKGARPDGATFQARALQHAREGRIDDARESFSAGIQIDSSHIPLYHAWGQLETSQDNVSAARDIYQRGIWASRNERQTTSLWTAWAMLEERAGDARAYLREALRRDRFAVDVRVTWGGFEARVGNIVNARQLYEGAIAIDPSNMELWYAFEDMERSYGDPTAAITVQRRGELAMEAAGRGGGGAPMALAGQTAPAAGSVPIGSPVNLRGVANGNDLQQAAQTALAWVRAASTAQQEQSSASTSDQLGPHSLNPVGTRQRTAVEQTYGDA